VDTLYFGFLDADPFNFLKFQKRSKHKKHKKDRKRRRHSSPSSSCEEFSETKKNRDNRNDRNDDWKDINDLVPTFERKKERPTKKDVNRSCITLPPGQSARELNPYWRNGGCGLPTEFLETASKEKINLKDDEKEKWSVSIKFMSINSSLGPEPLLGG